MVKADQRALSNVARKLLTQMANTGKGEPTSPAILESALRELGGSDAFGKIIADELKRSRGENLNPEEQADFKRSPYLTYKWTELLSRISQKVDGMNELDVESLSHEDLVNNLQALASDLVESNSEFRKLIVSLAISEDPSLVNDVLEQAGMKAVDGKVVGSEDSDDEDDEDDDGLDYDEAG